MSNSSNPIKVFSKNLLKFLMVLFMPKLLFLALSHQVLDLVLSGLSSFFLTLKLYEVKDGFMEWCKFQKFCFWGFLLDFSCWVWLSFLWDYFLWRLAVCCAFDGLDWAICLVFSTYWLSIIGFSIVYDGCLGYFRCYLIFVSIGIRLWEVWLGLFGSIAGWNRRLLFDGW